MKIYPKVSVIINCLNGQNFLYKAVQSVLKQDYPNLEIIFWDNNSSDNSIEEIKKIKSKRNIKIYKSNKTIKLYEARNAAVSKCKGYYVAFLDVDDTWEKNKITSQVKKLRNEKTDIVYSNHWILERWKKFIFSKENLPKGFITKEILINYPVMISTVLMKKKTFSKIGKFNKIYEIIGDFDFIFRISLSKKISVVQKPLATYKIHSLNTSSLKLKLRISEMENWLKKNNKLLEKKGFLDYCDNIKKRNRYLLTNYYISKKKYKLFFQSFLKVKSNLLKSKLVIKLLIKIIK